MKRTRRVSGCLLSLCLAGMACGSDSQDGGAACGDFDACGGKLEGGWKLTDACFIILEPPKLDFCEGATADLQAKKAEGSLTFEAETYERHIELETLFTLDLPQDCKQQAGETRACSAFGGTLQNGGALVCEDATSGGGCTCTTTLMSTFNDSGAYTIRGNRVELVSESVDYCVKGETLTLRPTVSISMSGASGTNSQLQTTFEKN